MPVDPSVMSSSPAPTLPAPLLTSEQLTVVAASFSSFVFFVVIVVMLSVIYRKDPHCCKLRSYQSQHVDMASPAPQYYSSRQMLVGSPYEQTHRADNSMQPDQLFYVGLPSSYNLEAPMPRLPSYESVRKKDRQRHIHMMIADRFGLNGNMAVEPPPSYEESIRNSVEIPYSTSPLYLDVTDMSFTNGGFSNENESPPTAHDCNTDNGNLPV